MEKDISIEAKTTSDKTVEIFHLNVKLITEAFFQFSLNLFNFDWLPRII